MAVIFPASAYRWNHDGGIDKQEVLINSFWKGIHIKILYVQYTVTEDALSG